MRVEIPSKTVFPKKENGNKKTLGLDNNRKEPMSQESWLHMLVDNSTGTPVSHVAEQIFGFWMDQKMGLPLASNRNTD